MVHEKPLDAAGEIVTFYSYKGGTGRTMALANCAWILAAAGHRVLMIDWDLEAPGLHRFFHPFLDPERLRERSGVVNIIDEYCDSMSRDRSSAEHWWQNRRDPILENVVPVNWRFEDGGSLDFISAYRTNPVFSAGLGRWDWDVFYNELEGNRLLNEMRLRLKASYDYVLIDSRTGQSDIETICTKDLPDQLVVCFTLSDQNIEGAAALARHVHEIRSANQKRDQIRILPVVTRIEDAETDRLEVGLAVARARFVQFVGEFEREDPNRYWNLARIPYKPRYAYEELLAVFGDAPGNPASMLASFERIVGLLTKNRVTALAPMSEAIRLRHRDSFTRLRPAEPSDVYISALSADDGWVRWLSWLLRGIGYQVTTDPGGTEEAPMDAESLGRMRSADRSIAVVSRAYQDSALARSVWQEQDELDPARTGRLAALRVDEPEAGNRLRWPHVADAFGKSEAEAIGALLRALGSDQSIEQALASASAMSRPARYPRSKPKVWNLRARMATFTGRETVLNSLRSSMSDGAVTAVLPQAVFGLGGVGKSALALEYAYRYQHDYDIVWWVRAEQRNIANEDLALLGEQLNLRSADNIFAAAEATKEALRMGQPYDRWLLIFDNADKPEMLQPLLPAGTTGHVLITSRNSAWAASFGSLEVDVFTRAESIEHLTRRVGGLSKEEAGRVAAELGDLPLAVELAAAWLGESGMSVDDYIDRLRREVAATLESGRARDYEDSVVATWRVAIENVRASSPAAARLLQLFAFCGPEPIALDLVYSDAMIDALLPFDRRLSANKMMIGRYIQDLGRYALVKVFRGTPNAVQVHRLIQQTIREDVKDPQEEHELRRLVHGVLAAARPSQGDVDNPETWERYARIWPHLHPSQAFAGNGDVRQLYVDRARYLRIRGELPRAMDLVLETVAEWETRPDIGPDDPRTLSMRFELACVLRALGDVRQSLEIDEDVLHRQLVHPEIGPEHIGTLITASGLAGDYRALGRFADALELDRQTYDSLLSLFGPDHPRTLMTASNLAVSMRANGLLAEALEIDRRTLAERLQVLGPGHPLSFNSAVLLARDLRDAGDREESLAILIKSYNEAVLALGDEHPSTVEAAKALAVSYRKAGKIEESNEVLGRLAQLLGAPEQIQTVPQLGYVLSVAANRAAFGDSVGALELAELAVERYADHGTADHPDALVGVNNVGIYLRQLDRTAEGREVVERAYRGLMAALGESHLLTLACAINVANSLAETGEPDAAIKLYLDIIKRLHGTLAALPAADLQSHPDLLACQANLAVTLHDEGRHAEAEAERTRILAVLETSRGESHPNTVGLADWCRIERELDTVPL